MKALILACLGGCVFAQPLTERERMLLDRIDNLERRLAALESKMQSDAAPVAEVKPALSTPGDWTVNVDFDGYYGYSFNRPFTQINAGRAYDVSANSFSINQAGLVLEHAPDPAAGRRAGLRLDLMFGQATESLQGSRANERRPEVYRHIFQAYGTYVAPLGKGLAVDFGKFASAFGIEGNYTKDQINYSRSYWFSFLPFYHMGLRASYPLGASWSASYWLTNGVNQTEDFNAFKSHAVLLNYNPAPPFSANLNYFTGQEQPRTPAGAPRGRSHFLDSYFTWDADGRLTVAGEADYVVGRIEPDGPPQRVSGGAGYARYRFHSKFSLGGRFAYLNDSTGLFSGASQTLKDATLTATFDAAPGFQMRWEYRRDWSSAAWFANADPARPKREQNTALLGLLWWFGGKRGPW